MNENRLEGLREERNLKSKEVAKLLKVAESTYSEWEHNKIPIPTNRLVQIANLYEINIDYILKLTDIKINIKSSPKLDLTIIGRNLKTIRNELNLTLRELGEKFQYSFSSLGAYERGEHLVQSNILINICTITNCSIDWVLGRSNIKYINKDN